MFKATSLAVGSIFFLSMIACADDSGIGEDEVGDDNFNGVYVNCVGNGYTQEWATWSIGPGGHWVITDADPLQTCIGFENISGADGAPFTFDEWEMNTNSFPAYQSQIAGLCEEKCWEFNQNMPDDSENPNGVCGATGWDNNVTEPFWDPGDGYNCYTKWADEGTTDDPYAETINWSGGSPPLSLPLECSLLDECYLEFDGNIGAWTQAWQYGGELGPITPMERGADYYATTSATTLLSLDMAAGSGVGYDDAEQLDGYAEYSASDCGESTCPFYLASFSASNDTDSWDVWVTLAGIFSEQKHIENVQIDMLDSSLGAWRPGTGDVAFLPGTLLLGISFDVWSDCTGCTGLGDDHYDLILRNYEVVFGEFTAGGFVLEQTFSILDAGEATLEVEMDAQEGPPTASIDLSAEVECDDVKGYILGASASDSTDPDNDIETEMWIVDDIAVPNNTSLVVGTYDVALGVVDARGAWDFTDEQEVEVLVGPACI